ncbi:MAG TPA: azurin [Edaphocola sp.]|nr:azurin [Edaphocola sp.]
MKKSIIAIASLAFFFASCGGGSETPATTETPAATEAPAAETAAPAETPATQEITINAGDDMKFDVTELKAKAGQKIKLTLHHTGKAPVTAMGHNVVFLKMGTNVDDFAKAAIAAKDNEYVPKDLEGEVIAHTKTIGGGESTTIEFTAPEAGVYDYICSFPGHHGTMHGTLTVE